MNKCKLCDSACQWVFCIDCEKLIGKGLDEMDAERDQLKKSLKVASRGAETNAHANRMLADRVNLLCAQLADAREQIAARDAMMSAASWVEFYVGSKSYNCAWDTLDKCWVRYIEPNDDNETGDVSKFHTLLDAYNALKS